MLRTVARVEERPWLLLGLVFFVTCFFGFLVQAAGSAWLRWQDDPIASTYRTTLSYTSALPGSPEESNGSMTTSRPSARPRAMQ